MTVKLLTEYHLEFLSLKGGCISPSEYTIVETHDRLKSQVVAHKCIQQDKVHLFSIQLSRDMLFPTMWHFDKCRSRRACAAPI